MSSLNRINTKSVPGKCLKKQEPGFMVFCVPGNLYPTNKPGYGKLPEAISKIIYASGSREPACRRHVGRGGKAVSSVS